MYLCQATSLRVKQLLSEKNFTSYKLAKMSGLPYSTISMLLNCKTKNTGGLIILNICRGLNVSLCEFYNSELFNPENLDDTD